MGVIFLWLLSVYAEEGIYINDRKYDELFEDKIQKAINASNSLEETVALPTGQTMAAYPPTEPPTIQYCWKSSFLGIWKPPPVKQVLDHNMAFECKEGLDR